MITARQNPWSPALDGTPWTQKGRPGRAATRTDRLARRATSAPVPSAARFTTYVSGNQITSGMTMSNDARIKRMLREAQVTEDNSAGKIENAFVTLVIVALTLFIYWGTAALVLGAAQQESKARKSAPVASNAAPQAAQQIRSTETSSRTAP